MLSDPGAHEQGAEIVATAFNATNPFRYLSGDAEQAWSALEWAQSRAGWLFLTSTEDSREAALPLQSVWLDCVVRRLMAEQERRGPVWIIADELPVLKRQSQLETLVVRGRKRGLCAVLGFQAITQLRAIYGHEQTATLAAAPATKLILRTALREQRNSFSVHPQRLIESAVRRSEIQMLQPFEGYLCITGHHRARVTIPYLAPVKRHPGFIRRLMVEHPNEQSATLIPEHNLWRPGDSAVNVAVIGKPSAGRRLRA